ncbi:hypothetical protein F5Y03DRAFT_244884 [Xylaria venustula]|nr:hypothetical protein F5Y03DRAFT_244884 [Xylaria venustula]
MIQSLSSSSRLLLSLSVSCAHPPPFRTYIHTGSTNEAQNRAPELQSSNSPHIYIRASYPSDPGPILNPNIADPGSRQLRAYTTRASIRRRIFHGPENYQRP